MKHFLVLLLTLCSSLVFGQSKILEYTSETLIPKDSTVVRGKLSNGLKYYIQKNDRPKKTVEMRLIIKVGSLQEEDDQLGVAHILEHMLFNGTKNFPKHKLIEYLENIGLKFGADLNAHTGFDETVYKLSIPTDDIEKVNTAFQILEDWAHNALLDDTEINAERGVVIEEYRLRQKGVFERVYAKYYDKVYEGTREIKRFPIGTEESILNFKPQRLKDFYADWYRPNLMGIAISGDIDMAYAEEKIKQHFTKLENPKDEKLLQDFGGLPVKEAKQILVLSDPEITNNNFYISFVDKEREAVDGARVEENYESIVTSCLNQMLNQRFTELAYGKTPPFISASVYRSGSIVANQASFGGRVSYAEGKFETALKAVYTELERAKRFGFTAKELADAKKNILANNETYYNKRNERYSKNLVGALLSEYKKDWVTVPVDWNYEFTNKAVEKINLQEVEAQYKKYYHAYNQKLLVVVPKKEDTSIPSKDAIAVSIKEVEGSTAIEGYKDAQLSTTLIKELSPQGTIVLEESLAYNIKKIVLSNGVEVYYKKTNFDTDHIAFKAYSYGGKSLLSNSEIKSIGNIQNLVKTTGIGGFKNHELQKVLAGKKANVNSFVSAYDENLGGKAKVVDMETFFKLIYLNFTGINKDEESYRTVTNKIKENLKNNGLNPKRVFQNAITNAYQEENPRYVNLYENHNFAKIIDSTSYDKAYDYFTKRFANAGDFKFFFVGDFKEEDLKTYVKTYIGSLPSTKEREKYQLHKFNKKPSNKNIIVNKGLADKAVLQIRYSTEAKSNTKEKKAMKIFATILQRKLRNKIREEKAGTYGIRARFGYHLRPIPKYSGYIGFECDPKSIETLKKEVLEVVANFKKEGPTKEEVESVLEQWALGRKKSLEQNDFWLGRIKNQVYWNKPIENLFKADKINKTITAKFVKKTAKKYVGAPELIAQLLPQKKDVVNAKE